MMNKAEKKFRWYAILAIFVLLTVLLGVINGTNFTMASEDADEITQMLARQRGAFPAAGGKREDTTQNGAAAPNGPRSVPQEPIGRMGPMGPSSPEVNASVRYFTFAFSASGKKAETVAFQISAVTEGEAEEWAKSLMDEASTGWTKGTYRYRVYKNRDLTFVTVIDQGRELLPSYRILIISAVGEVLGLVICWFFLLFAGRRLFAPLEEGDRKQKRFIANANKEFRLPLTIIDADTELLERAHGPSDYSRSIHRQVKKMTALVERLGSMGMYAEETAQSSEVPLSEFLRASLDHSAERFAARGLTVHTDIAPELTLAADPEAMKRLVDELIDNALKYARENVSFSLKREGDRILLETQNPAQLPDGPVNQAFDRFTTLENAEGGDSAGLGLAYVKEIVRAHHGRVSASVSEGTFTLRITL